MKPETVHTAALAMLLMGIAGAVVLVLGLVYPLAAAGLVLAWCAFGFTLELLASRALRH